MQGRMVEHRIKEKVKAVTPYIKLLQKCVISRRRSYLVIHNKLPKMNRILV